LFCGIKGADSIDGGRCGRRRRRRIRRCRGWVSQEGYAGARG